MFLRLSNSSIISLFLHRRQIWIQDCTSNFNIEFIHDILTIIAIRNNTYVLFMLLLLMDYLLLLMMGCLHYNCCRSVEVIIIISFCSCGYFFLLSSSGCPQSLLVLRRRTGENITLWIFILLWVASTSTSMTMGHVTALAFLSKQ